MKNELQIKPLMQYEVQRVEWQQGRDERVTDVFTAEEYEVVDNCRVRFKRTGNIVREYFAMPVQIIVTPADVADIPK
jgi:hypothetical protein